MTPRDSSPFCDAAHPAYWEARRASEPVVDKATKKTAMAWRTITTPTVHCRRMADHPGPHSAFTFSISVPERWTDE